jgi:hypothetical protein
VLLEKPIAPRGCRRTSRFTDRLEFWSLPVEIADIANALRRSAAGDIRIRTGIERSGSSAAVKKAKDAQDSDPSYGPGQDAEAGHIEDCQDDAGQGEERRRRDREMRGPPRGNLLRP